MGSGLKRRIKQAHFASPQQEALLNLSVAAAFLREQSERVVEAFDITLPQYNVLRILRGVHPNGHPRGEIAMRMLDRAPDVTRIVDRLSAKNLVERIAAATTNGSRSPASRARGSSSWSGWMVRCSRRSTTSRAASPPATAAICRGFASSCTTPSDITHRVIDRRVPPRRGH